MINQISPFSRLLAGRHLGIISRRVLFGLWLCVPALVAAPVLVRAAEIDRVLAIVDSDVITMNDYRSRHRQERFENPQLPPFNGEVNAELLGQLVDEQIQVTQATRRGISVSNREIDAGVQFVAQQNNLSVEQLVKQLEDRDFTYSAFRENMRNQQLIRKLVDSVANSRVVVSDQEIDNYLNSHQELESRDTSYELSHLFLLTTEKSAEEVDVDRENLGRVREAIAKGEEFSEAISDYSGSTANGDDSYLGWRSSDQLPELFLNALGDMDPEENFVSPVLQSENGLHLLKLHGKRGSEAVVEQQKIQHILVQPDEANTLEESLQQAQELYQKLQAGESFEKLARLHSDDAQSGNQGGLIGWVTPGELVPRFEEVASQLELNVVSEPVRTRYGYHLIKVLERRQSDRSSALAINEARQAIFQRKSSELYETWLENVRQRTYIEYVGL